MSLQTCDVSFVVIVLLEILVLFLIYLLINSIRSVFYLLVILVASNGVVLAAEKKQKSILYDESTVSKVTIILAFLKFSSWMFSYRLYQCAENHWSRCHLCGSLLRQTTILILNARIPTSLKVNWMGGLQL